jgi:hypothetical protein
MNSSELERKPHVHVKTDNNANQTHYYVSLIIAIAVGLTGVFLRFVDDNSFLLHAIANILLLVAAIFAIRTVLRIIK